MAISLEEVVKNKGYIGGLKSDANPKTRDWWVDVIDWVVILDPQKVAVAVEKLKAAIDEAVSAGKKVLIIYEKSLLREEIEQMAAKKGVYYLNYKVPGGILTNFDTILKRVRSMNELRDFINSPQFQLLTKKEKLTKERELQKLEMVYKGIKDLDSHPDLVIVVDGMYKPSLLDEVKKSRIPYFVITSPSLNRELDEDRIVVTNVQSYKALRSLLEYVLS